MEPATVDKGQAVITALKVIEIKVLRERGIDAKTSLEQIGNNLDRLCFWVGQMALVDEPDSQWSLLERFHGNYAEVVQRFTEQLDRLKSATDDLSHSISLSGMERYILPAEKEGQNADDYIKPLEQITTCISTLFEIAGACFQTSMEDAYQALRKAHQMPVDQLDQSDAATTIGYSRRDSMDGSTLFSGHSRRNSTESRTSLEDLMRYSEIATTSAISHPRVTQLSQDSKSAKKAARERKKDLLEEQRELAMTYEDEGRTEEAIELRERLVVEWEKMAGEEDARTLEAQRMLALLYQDSGYGEKALILRQHIAAVRERTEEVDNLHRLEAQRQLAISYRRNGRANEAQEVRQRFTVTKGVLAAAGSQEKKGGGLASKGIKLASEKQEKNKERQAEPVKISAPETEKKPTESLVSGDVISTANNQVRQRESWRHRIKLVISILFGSKST